MQFILNAVNEKSGVKAVVVLLIISSLIFAYSLVAMGAPGITYGDINEDDEIDVRDVVLIMRYILDLETLTEDQLTAADVTGDGEVDVRDATKIMQFVLGLIDEFPVYLKVDSVEAIEITVSSGTAYADIDFPDTVKAALYNETEKDIDVEWGEESDPEYDPSISGSYEFEGELVDLPDGVTNPEEIMASATVKVQYRYIPPRRDPVDPETSGEVDIVGPLVENQGSVDVTVSNLVEVEGDNVYVVLYNDTQSAELDTATGVGEETITMDGFDEADIDANDNVIVTIYEGGAAGDSETNQLDTDTITVAAETSGEVDIVGPLVENQGSVDVTVSNLVEVEGDNVYVVLYNDTQSAELDTATGIGEETITIDGFDAADIGADDEVSATIYEGGTDGDSEDNELDSDQVTVQEVHTVDFIERNEVNIASLAVYENDTHVGDAEIGGDEYTATKDLVDNSYTFTATAEETVYGDYKGEFTVDGADKDVKFQFNTTEYEFTIDESASEYVYDEDNFNNQIDSSYYVYASEKYITTANDYVYETEPATEYVYAPDLTVDFESAAEKVYGYDEVKFKFEIVDIPDNEVEDVFFVALDAEIEMSIENGYIYSGKIDIPAEDVLYQWKPMFIKYGEYEITFSLICAMDNNNETDTVIANITKTVKFDVQDEPPENNIVLDILGSYSGWSE